MSEELDSPAASAAKLERKLRGARAQAIAALEREEAGAEGTDALQRAATGLGEVLRQAANEDGLWYGLSQRDGLAALTDRERRYLKTMTEVDWTWLLKRRGYDVTWDPHALARATKAVLSGEQVDVEETRESVRELAGLLDADHRDVSQLRQRVKAGARIAGKLAIIAGVAAAAVAAGPLVPAAIAIHGVGGAVVGGLMQTGATGLIGKAVKQVLGHDRGAEPSLERLGEQLLATVKATTLSGLEDAWRSDLELRKRFPAGQLDSSSLISVTRSVLERLMTAGHMIWEASVGASWAA